MAFRTFITYRRNEPHPSDEEMLRVVMDWLEQRLWS
jgi:hypothetical protein